MKSLMNKVFDKTKSIVNKTKDFAKKNYNTIALTGAMALASTAILSPTRVYSQNPSKSYTNNIKTTQVDTLWGANNSTPDSVAYNIFSRPNIVKTYGKEGNDPNLDWEGMSPSEKANYFTKVMGEFIKLYPKYDEVNNNGDTIFSVGSEPCYFYTTLANYVIEGENNLENLPDPRLKLYPDIEKITFDNNGHFNLPHLYITDVSNNGQSHSVSGVYIKDKVTQNTNLESDFQIRDSKTNISALPGTPPMAKQGSVTTSWEGYSDGQFVQYGLMYFKFDSTGKSHLVYINPKLITINPHIIDLQNKSPSDRVINYSKDWEKKLKNFVTSVNQDTKAKIHTDDGANTVDISYLIQNKESFLDTIPLMSGEAGKYNFTVIRKDLAQFLQKGVQDNGIFILNYYTTLKEKLAQQKITVKDMEAPTGSLRKTDTTLTNKANALEVALSMVENVKDNSNGTVYKTDSLTYDSDSLVTYLIGLKDVTGNKTSLGKVNVHISTTGINDPKAQSEKYGIMKVWPNPVFKSQGNNLFFDYNVKTSGQKEIEFYDVAGRKELTTTKNMKKGENKTHINLEGLSKGLHIVRIKSKDGNTYTKKLIIQ